MVRDGQTYYYHFNGHGDVVALTDSTGAVAATYEYDAWGNITASTGTIENPYRYAGYRYDKETGLYFLNARYYEPEIGRFVSRDSFHGFADKPESLNQYSYANNNPIMFIDPDGHIAWMLVGAATGGILAYLSYMLEVEIGARKWNTSHMYAIVGSAAALGAINGGLSGMGKFGGLINKAVKLGYISSKEAKNYKRFLSVKTMILNSVIKIPLKNGSESWYNWAKKMITDFKIRYF